ncbi:MAG TPA: hypothetical protein VKB38_00350 [Terracidiphilus sp.]|nr:hypothetical protein [Terracidiphilus sp.]
MQAGSVRRNDPELKQIIREASQALALLDASRLGELALCCSALNRNLESAGAPERAELARQARGAAGDLATFARVLDATRANLTVMQRLRELRQGQLEYRDAALRPTNWEPPETSHGND